MVKKPKIIIPLFSDNSDAWSEASKGIPKYDDKCSDFIPISYEPSSVTVIPVQCFHLPLELNEDGFKVIAFLFCFKLFILIESIPQITMLLPSKNGQLLIAVVNRDGRVFDKIQSAVLVYQLNFTECGPSIQVGNTRFEVYGFPNCVVYLQFGSDKEFCNNILLSFLFISTGSF